MSPHTQKIICYTLVGSTITWHSNNVYKLSDSITTKIIPNSGIYINHLFLTRHKDLRQKYHYKARVGCLACDPCKRSPPEIARISTASCRRKEPAQAFRARWRSKYWPQPRPTAWCWCWAHRAACTLALARRQSLQAPPTGRCSPRLAKTGSDKRTSSRGKCVAAHPGARYAADASSKTAGSRGCRVLEGCTYRHFINKIRDCGSICLNVRK